MPGQTYVAISRVREEAALKVTGFQRIYLLPQSGDMAKLLSSQAGTDPVFRCCKSADMKDRLLQRGEFISKYSVPCEFEDD